jgi:hypothetical protein
MLRKVLQTGHSALDLVSTECIIMYPPVDDPICCEVRVVSFLHTGVTGAAEIHCKLRAAACSQNVMCEGKVKEECRMFRDCWNYRSEELSGGSSVVTCSDLVQIGDQSICERQFHNARTSVRIFTNLAHSTLLIITVTIG